MDTKLLDKEFDAKFIKQIKGFNYVSAEVIAERLDKVCGKFNWAFVVDPKDVWMDDEEILVPGKMGMRDPETGEWVWKSQVGGAQIMYRKGTDHTPENRVELHKRQKAAYSDCMKKCATQWGVARHLYGEVEHDEESEDPDAARIASIQRGEEQLSKKLNKSAGDLRQDYFSEHVDDLVARTPGELEEYLTHLRSLRDADKPEQPPQGTPKQPAGDKHMPGTSTDEVAQLKSKASQAQGKVLRDDLIPKREVDAKRMELFGKLSYPEDAGLLTQYINWMDEAISNAGSTSGSK